MKQYLDLSYLKAHCSKIHGFGLGFIQIKLDDTERVHVYTQRIKTTSQAEEIHNHRYDFTSYILKGCLGNKLYQVTPDEAGSFLLVNEACNPLVPKKIDQIKVQDPLLMGEFISKEHQSYFLQKDVFHQVSATEGTITLVRRGIVTKESAQVVFPAHQTSICPFSNTYSEEELWQIVKELL